VPPGLGGARTWPWGVRGTRVAGVYVVLVVVNIALVVVVIVNVALVVIVLINVVLVVVIVNVALVVIIIVVVRALGSALHRSRVSRLYGLSRARFGTGRL
jgi:hypothetical protein